METVVPEFQACLNALERGDAQTVISKLESLAYDVRLTVLERKGWPGAILINLAEDINRESRKEQRSNTQREDNPIKMILDMVNPTHRARLLLMKCWNYDKTVLHEACRHDDTETVRVIIDSVTDQLQRTDLVFAQDLVGSTPLHTAAEFATEETVTYLITSVPIEKSLINLQRSDECGETALHKSAVRSANTVCLQLLKFSVSAQTPGSSLLSSLILHVILTYKAPEVMLEPENKWPTSQPSELCLRLSNLTD